MIILEDGESTRTCLDRNKIPALLDWDILRHNSFCDYTILNTKTAIKLHRLSVNGVTHRLIRGTKLWKYLK